ncbi:MAG: hypothetical protein RIC55_27760 [Pirellulaceae bacterium]
MSRLVALVVVLFSPLVAAAQYAPGIGYMFPPGGRAGETVEVTLGGYDWTPDMQLLVHDERIKLEIISPLSEVIVPEPPYWFGKKARRSPFLLPREAKAKLTIPADVPPGVVRWQAANANGATASGRFVVGAMPEVVDHGDRQLQQTLPSLPVTVSGQIKHIEEVDRYHFTASKTGPISIALCARELGSELNAAIEIHDDQGRPIADVADTAGIDTAVTFAARAGHRYTASIYDVDFRGNRAFVYRLSFTEAPRVAAAIPAVGKPGETRDVELVGYGVKTGAAKLESVVQPIAFPRDAKDGRFLYQLETAHGTTTPIELTTSEQTETLEGEWSDRPLTLPAAVSGVLEELYGEDQYRLSGVKGDKWAINVESKRVGAPLDVAAAIVDAEGVERARSDDAAGSTNAALEFTVPADGEYRLLVSDVSGRSGDRAATYRLTVEAARPGFTLSAPEMASVPIGGKFSLSITAVRHGGYLDPIAISLAGAPVGVTIPEEVVIPAKKTALKLELSAADNLAAAASLVTIVGTATIGEETITSTTAPLLLATTITPPFSIDAEGKDDVTKWPRGTTFPAPVLIQRNEGFHEPIVLEMTSKQGRHRQGIRGPELVVEDGVERILYPVFLPEWLETTRTSRMVVNGVAQVADPQGNVRYSLVRQKTRMGFLPTGALLKLSADRTEFTVEPGKSFDLPLTVSRARQLPEPVTIELVHDAENPAPLDAQPQTLETPGSQPIALTINAAPSMEGGREHELTLRATVLQAGGLPVVSETRVIVVVAPQ